LVVLRSLQQSSSCVLFLGLVVCLQAIGLELPLFVELNQLILFLEARHEFELGDLDLIQDVDEGSAIGFFLDGKGNTGVIPNL
jgi:hypothetical protein